LVPFVVTDRAGVHGVRHVALGPSILVRDSILGLRRWLDPIVACVHLIVPAGIRGVRVVLRREHVLIGGRSGRTLIESLWGLVRGGASRGYVGWRRARPLKALLEDSHRVRAQV